MLFSFLQHRKSFSEKEWHEVVAGQDPASLYEPHYDPERQCFFNPWYRQEKTLLDVFAYFLDKNRYGQLQAHNHPLGKSWSYDPAARDHLAMLGHSFMALQVAGKLLFFDPFISSHAFNIKRCRPAATQLQDAPGDCIVIISHNHYDHFDIQAIKKLKHASFICPLGMGSLLRKQGVNKICELDWWQESGIDNIKAVCLPAHHWSRSLTQAANKSLWAAWLIEIDNKKVFFGGDSAYFVGYKEIGRRFPGIDLALLPCGAFAPRWFMHHAHLDVNEMFMSFADLRASHLVPIHWGSIVLGHEPANEPRRLIEQYLSQNPHLQSKVHILDVADKLLLWP